MAIEPPRSSLYFLIVSAAAGATTGIAALGGQPALASILFGWGFLVIVLMYRAGRPLDTISVQRRITNCAFEGDPVEVEIEVDYTGRAPLPFVDVIDRFPASLTPDTTLYAREGLRRGERRRFTTVVRCTRHWGIYPEGRTVIEVTDRLGFFRRQRVFDFTGEFVVLPEVFEVAFLHHQRGLPRLVARDAPNPRAGLGLDYLGTRDFRPSDERRHIHWPATARHGSLMVKEFESEVQPTVTLFLDLDRRHRAGTGRKSTVDTLVRVAASVLATAVRRGESIQLYGDADPGVEIEVGFGRDHLIYALSELIRVRQNGDRSIYELVRERSDTLPPLSTVVLLLGTETPDLDELEAVIHDLRGRQLDVYLVMIEKRTYRPLDEWPLTLEEYEARATELDEWLDEHGVHSLRLDAELDLESTLAGQYARRRSSTTSRPDLDLTDADFDALAKELRG